MNEYRILIDSDEIEAKDSGPESDPVARLQEEAQGTAVFQNPDGSIPARLITEGPPGEEVFASDDFEEEQAREGTTAE